MEIIDRVHLVGSGAMGFGLTDPFDCHVFLIDGGAELALVDVGAGMGCDAILANARSAGFALNRVRSVVLTHAHGDHAGGTARMRERLPDARFLAAPQAGAWLEAGDDHGASIDVARDAGIYPSDYVLEPATIDAHLRDDDTLQVGDLELTVIDTPGHADGHLSLLLERAGRRTLFSGDAVFFGGKILLQNLHDCRLDAQIRTLRRLRGLNVDALLPSHLAFSIVDGQRHIEAANEALDRLLIPNQLVPA